MMPAEGVLQYYVRSVHRIRQDRDLAVIYVTDGFAAKVYEHQHVPGSLPDPIPDAGLQIAWSDGEPVTMREYREAGHVAVADLVREAVDAALVVIQGSAEPVLPDVLAAIGGVLQQEPRKFLEFQKIAIMLRDGDAADVRKFMTFAAIVAMVGAID